MKTAAKGVSLAALFAGAGLPEPVPEFQFLTERRFRLDWAWPAWMVSLEVDGGVFAGGRHTRGTGFARDCVKQALAVLGGWMYLRCTPQQLQSGEALAWVEQALKFRGWRP